MVAALQKLWNETAGYWPAAWGGARATHPESLAQEEVLMVGEYRADYDDLPPGAWQAEVPEMEQLLRESKVVSVNRGL